MAASATTAATTTYICRRQASQSSSSANVRMCFCSSVKFGTQNKARRFHMIIIRNSSGDDGAPAESSGAAATAEMENEEESPVEVQKAASSLISALNVEKALRGIAITDTDHYGRLGLQKGCSIDQVTAAYKSKVEELMNQDLDEDQLSKKIELYKESHLILSTPEERRLYDWSIARSSNPDKYVWPFEVDKSPTSTEDPPPQEPEDVEPTRYVGYFMLTWLILAFTLSIALNR